jgi:hypothetical protein
MGVHLSHHSTSREWTAFLGFAEGTGSEENLKKLFIPCDNIRKTSFLFKSKTSWDKETVHLSHSFALMIF